MLRSQVRRTGYMDQWRERPVGAESKSSLGGGVLRVRMVRESWSQVDSSWGEVDECWVSVGWEKWIDEVLGPGVSQIMAGRMCENSDEQDYRTAEMARGVAALARASWRGLRSWLCLLLSISARNNSKITVDRRDIRRRMVSSSRGLTIPLLSTIIHISSATHYSKPERLCPLLNDVRSQHPSYQLGLLQAYLGATSS
jgi:hypothetical protein